MIRYKILIMTFEDIKVELDLNEENANILLESHAKGEAGAVIKESSLTIIKLEKVFIMQATPYDPEPARVVGFPESGD
jgi:hypothetical protein